MTPEDIAATIETPTWSVEMFAQFWANPDPALVPVVLTDDVVGYWAGRDEPVRGKDDYTACIAAVVEALPDMAMEVLDHARDGDLTFVRWILRATGEHGPFEITGIDRVRTEGPLVAENVIVFDTAAFERRSGMRIPWA
jgi:SnoaL-like polyketide cyclase